MPDPQIIQVTVEGATVITARVSGSQEIQVVYTGEPLLAPPSGFIFLSDGDGALLLDSDGAYLTEHI